MSHWLRLHRLPKDYYRAALPGQTHFEQLLGVESPRQRHIRERSAARYNLRDDRVKDAPGLLAVGEIGRVDGGFRFITSPAAA